MGGCGGSTHLRHARGWTKSRVIFMCRYQQAMVSTMASSAFEVTLEKEIDGFN